MSDRPRVAVTLTQCWHLVPGGSATSILGLVDAVASTGEVDLVGVGPAGELRRPSTWATGRGRGRLPEPPFTPTIPLRRVGLPLPILYDAWERLGRPSIESAVGAVDLVHLTIPVPVPPSATPVVATVHDLVPLTEPELLTGRGARLTRAGIEWIRTHARRVMVPSRSVEAECVEHGFDPERIRVVPWGVDLTASEPAAEQVERVLRRHSVHAPYVLFVGTVEPRKNLAGLMRAMSRLGRPDVSLVLVGPDGWGPSLDGELAGVPGPVRRLGFLPSADVAALQRGAAAFCFPSLVEGFGLPVLEAMAAGAAVVTSAGTATEEVGGDGAVLVDPRDPDAIAAAIGALIDDPDEAASLRSRGRHRAGTFRWDDAARRTIEVYREALA